MTRRTFAKLANTTTCRVVIVYTTKRDIAEKLNRKGEQRDMVKKTEKTTEYKVKVLKVREFESGDIALDMDVNGVTIYGCVYKTGSNDKGDYAFVSFPSRKGNDGKYYSHAYFKITSECLADIEKQIEKML